MGILQSLVLIFSAVTSSPKDLRTFVCHIERLGGKEDVVMFVAKLSSFEKEIEKLKENSPNTSANEKVFRVHECRQYIPILKKHFKSEKANVLLEKKKR
ncbi:hypothetical protein [Algicola sagamiensis]|uniref:hypothetical protein n=1 Tax=Algicola sagamiensis TaxID=163869 RepID=UPI00037F8F27|nr:hypothetical protein [Algicola sagamiensis]